MKKYVAVLLILIGFLGCDSESGWDCIKKAGSIVQEEYTLPLFDKVDLGHRVSLFITQGDNQQVILETGKNLQKKIDIQVVEGRLIINNNNTCNLIREYGLTKVYITVQDLKEIRNSSGGTIRSTNKLQLNDLALLSEDTNNEDAYNTDGDFYIDMQVERLQIVSNGIANFFLSGVAEKATIGLYSGDSRVEASNLIIDDLTLFHRSTNKMIVHPRQSIVGEIRSVGDVIAVHQPPVVEVVEFYTGRLIFQ